MNSNTPPTKLFNVSGNRISALIAGILTAAFTQPVTATEPARESPAQLVDALHSAFGEHHARAVHAKGVILEGTFVPTPEARELSKATLFTKAL